jgi:DGQHR domain-containing protein
MRPPGEQMQFYLGTHHPTWLGRVDVPLFVSRRRLAPRIASRGRMPRARAPWALDSGGFTELSVHGQWTISPEQYVEEVRVLQREIGQLSWAAAMDWMCEPDVRARTGRSVQEHQCRTVENYLRLMDLAPDIPWVPVVQGWSSGDHLRCVDLYERAGIRLHQLDRVGVGTICRRSHTGEAAEIVQALYERLGPRLHAFGAGKSCRGYHTYLRSADSMAWSFAARMESYETRRWHPGAVLRDSANRLSTALAYREEVLAATESYPIRRQWAAGAKVMAEGKAKTSTLRVLAVETRQGGRVAYHFSMDGKLMPLIAAVSRVRRNERRIEGYQRPEIRQHIAGIRRYLERPEAMLLNSILVALDENRARFTPLDVGAAGAQGAVGMLEIPLDAENPAGWVIDGQQRMAAIRDAEVDAFQVPCTAVLTSCEVTQREEFIKANSARNLPRLLLDDLLPATRGGMPARLEKGRFAMEVVEALNFDADSPIKGAVKTPSHPSGWIAANSIKGAVQRAQEQGMLAGVTDPDKAARLLKDLFRAARATWPGALDLPPKESRLTHGAGIAALIGLLEEIATTCGGSPGEEQIRRGLELIGPQAAWTRGHWPSGRRWNDVENTSRAVAMFGNEVRHLYRSALLGGATAPGARDAA